MKLTIAFVLGTTLFAFGQRVTLDVVNPMPRVKDQIEITVTVESTTSSQMQGEIAARVKLKDMCLDTGLVTIGPFKFVVNNQLFETGKLELKVGPELPLDIVDGLWINVFNFNSKSYLVIEQRVANRINKERNLANEVVVNKSEEELLFAELNEELLLDKGVSILSTHSSSGKKITTLKDPRGSFTYKTTIYTYELTPEYQGTFEITKDYFKDFPLNTQIDNIWIRNIDQSK